MGFGVKDDSSEIKGIWRSEQQVEIFEGFRKEKTLHRI
jgi:hypothetical protein